MFSICSIFPFECSWGGKSDLHEAATAGVHQRLHGRRQCYSARGAPAVQLVSNAANATRSLQGVSIELTTVYGYIRYTVHFVQIEVETYSRLLLSIWGTHTSSDWTGQSIDCSLQVCCSWINSDISSEWVLYMYCTYFRWYTVHRIVVVKL